MIDSLQWFLTSRRCIPLPIYTHVDSAPLSILASLLSSKFLHREIRQNLIVMQLHGVDMHGREKGGAYGGGASASNNVFRFYSYRDPKFAPTDSFNANVHIMTSSS